MPRQEHNLQQIVGADLHLLRAYSGNNIAIRRISEARGREVMRMLNASLKEELSSVILKRIETYR
jgi:hypothetical protein